MLSKPSALVRLHRQLVRQCRVLRRGEMPWTNDRPPTKLDRLYRRRYGTQHVMKFFKPHLTLGQFKRPEDAAAVCRRVAKLKFSFLGDTVAIGAVNHWHQMTKIVKTFTLKR